MEDFGFDINGLLSEEEAEKLFEEASREPEEKKEPEKEPEEEQKPAEEETQPSEKVGEEGTERKEDTEAQHSDGSSPVYSSIASALKKDGIFPDFSDDEVAAVKTPEDFAELFEKAISAKLDEKQRRIDEALSNGVAPSQVKQFEETLEYLGSIDEEALSAEGEEGDNLRKQLIFNDFLTRGFSEEKANKEVEKSFRSNSEVDDAKDALAALKSHFQGQYEALQKDARDKADKFKKDREAETAKFKKMVLEDELKLGETVLDKKTCQKVYDAVMVPVHKDEQSGRYITAVQKFQLENPLEFLKQLGMWFVLTNGGKDTDGLIKSEVRKEKNKGIRELEQMINTTQFNSDGTLRYPSGHSGESDPLLSDGWQIG